MTAESQTLEPPRFESLGSLKLVGLERVFTGETRGAIPKLWEEFAPWIGKIPSQIGGTAYGLMWDEKPQAGFHYMACVEVPNGASVPEGLVEVNVAEQRYAVFTHRAHVSELFETMCAIYQQWVPKTKVNLIDGHWFERYGEDFDAATGMGSMEIWLPVTA